MSGIRNRQVCFIEIKYSMLYYYHMNGEDTQQDPGKLKAIAAAYADFKKKAQALEDQQFALLKEAMGILKEDKMLDARKKLEQMLLK